MQNPNMAQMAQMNAGAGPMDGTPVMNGQRPQPPHNYSPTEPRDLLNTYIYEYFCRTDNHKLAKAMLEAEMNVAVKPKSSPRNMNGVDAIFGDLPMPNLPANQATEQSFLLDWWVQFWDIFSAARGRQNKGYPYIQHARNVMQQQTEQRNQRFLMQGGVNSANYQAMLQQRMPNGVPPNDLKRAAAMNNRPNGNPMANMNQMKNQAIMSAQMQRDGSQMDMNGQRPQSPGSNENGGSPNKRQRVEGAMNAGNMPGNQFGEFAQQGPNAQQKQIEVYAQGLAQQQRMALNNHQGMNNVAQGSPMNQPSLPGEGDMFVGNAPRPGGGIPTGQAPPGQGNHALQDYQMQLMLLEQQNKKRLLMARQEQDSMASGPHAQGPVGGPGFPQAMSPQGSRAGPSPNPNDQMKKGATPRMGPQGLPGSPMPDGAMQPQRNSPAPGVAFDPNTMPPGMPPQYGNFPNGMNPQMMRPPPSSHPQFNGANMTPEMQQAMQRNQMAAMQNGGAWRGPQGQPMMMSGQQQMGGPMGANPQQNRQMPPPPAPAGEQPRTQEPSPSQQPAAPPTPLQGNKAKPTKKTTKDTKKPANKKGATGATPAASGGEEPQTPTAPITPVHPNKSFGQGPNGQQLPQAAQQQQPTQQQPQPMDNPGPGAFGQLGEENFGDLNLDFDGSALENFDFDSFLHVDDNNSSGFDSLGGDFGFGNGLEAGGE